MKCRWCGHGRKAMGCDCKCHDDHTEAVSIWGARPPHRVYRRDPDSVHPVDLLNGLRETPR